MPYISPLSTKTVRADEQDLFTEGSSVQPNVLLILDNSQSMDEDFVGNAVGHWRAGSRLLEGKKTLITLINAYANQMRIGLMTHKLPTVSAYHLHNAMYFASYEPKSYCPNPSAACQDSCYGSAPEKNPDFDATYRDEIITNYPVGSEQRNRYCGLVYPQTNRTRNPADTSNYIHYKLPGTYYDSSDLGNKFNYAQSYSGDDSPTDNLHCISRKNRNQRCPGWL